VDLLVDIVEAEGAFPVLVENVPELLTHRVYGQSEVRILDVGPADNVGLHFLCPHPAMQD